MGHGEFFGASNLFISGCNLPERAGLLLMNKMVYGVSFPFIRQKTEGLGNHLAS
jgi:hypothetical protein